VVPVPSALYTLIESFVLPLMYLPVEAVPVMVALMSSLPSLLLLPLLQIVYFYGEQSIVSTESSAVDESDDQSFYDIVTSNMGNTGV
jgi:hypothetical protein